MKKPFVSKEDYMEMSVYKLVAGILLGIIVAFIFYAFLYTMREGMRFMSFFHADILVLTDSQVNFYNLIFAYISLILGQSACFLYWINRPRQFLAKNNRFRTTMINDQRVMLWYFLSWFSKMAVAAVVFILLKAYFVFSLFPDFNYLFILLVIVLFLQSWNTIRRIHRKRSMKWLLISASIIILLGFGMSRINFIDYNALNTKRLNRNPIHKYNIHLPQSKQFVMDTDKSLILNIYIAAPPDSMSQKFPVIIVDGLEIPLNELHNSISKWIGDIPTYKLKKAYCRLSIDKNVRMEYVNKAKIEIARSGIKRISYAVWSLRDKGQRLNSYYDCSFRMMNSYADLYHADTPAPPGYYPFKSLYNDINIRMTGNTMNVNNYSVANDSLTNFLYNFLQYNPKSRMVFYYDSSLYFSDYFRILTATKEAVDNLRNEESLRKYKVLFIELDHDLKGDIYKKYPWNFVEKVL